MFFTNILLSYRNKFKPRMLPKGHLLRGKYKIIRPVTRSALKYLEKDLDREEKNMFYLRHPYITAEQYRGFPREMAFAVDRCNAYRKTYRDKRFMKNVDKMEIDAYLRKTLISSDKWE